MRKHPYVEPIATENPGQWRIENRLWRTEGNFGTISPMKKAIFAAAVSIAIAMHAAVLDGIAAKVNDNTITIGDVMNDIRRNPATRDRVATLDGDEEGMRALYRKTLDALIDRKLILEAAAAKKMEMQEWVVDNHIREIVKDNFGGDRNRLDAMLTESRVPFSEWRNMIKEDLVVRGMRYQIVDKSVSVSPAAMRREYNDHRELYSVDSKASVRVILLKPDADGKSAPVSTRGEEILGRLDKGEDFAALAMANSADSHAKNGGLWADVNPEEVFRPEIAKVLAQLKPGEYSQCIDLDGWGFIVRKESESGARQLSFEEAYDQIARNVREEATKTAYAEWMRRLREEAYVKIYPEPTAK